MNAGLGGKRLIMQKCAPVSKVEVMSLNGFQEGVIGLLWKEQSGHGEGAWERPLAETAGEAVGVHQVHTCGQVRGQQGWKEVNG